MIKKTIGGERLGSGNKIQAALHNYERSTHDLGNAFRTTAAPGVLIPFYKKLALNGDTWTIDLTSLVRTMPAIGPLFGSYKLQLDIFKSPIRLYQGVLHNNMTKIGMDMSVVKLPKVEISGQWLNPSVYSLPNWSEHQISSSSLLGYLGVRGIQGVTNAVSDTLKVTKEINAVPILAYYDIFKNYYANKQEENAYVIAYDVTSNNVGDVEVYERGARKWSKLSVETFSQRSGTPMTQNMESLIMQTSNIDDKTYKMEFSGTIDKSSIALKISDSSGSIQTIDLSDTRIANYEWEGNTLYVRFTNTNIGYTLFSILYLTTSIDEGKIKLEKFPLENIDLMRYDILSNVALGTTYYVNSANLLPYKEIYAENNDCNSKYPMNGLVVKTYQSDIFNCWLSSSWIDGIKGVNSIAAVDTSSGSFTIDALNLSKKVYNMLNRIAVSGGTYKDWQEAVYGEDAVGMVEAPEYCGGMSGTIAFEEVVSTADTLTDTAGDQPLGSLAGKGVLTNVKGGHVEIHIKEPSYIMGIMSITPLIDYSQGNEFDMTELDSIDDLHKPELDEIGFQNLMLERAAWWGDEIDEQTTLNIKHAVGKSPAWIEYMTSVNKVHGDFSDPNKLGYMVLNRNYEVGSALLNNNKLSNSDPAQYIPVSDWTTYIDPSKYNYQFANTNLDAQNFWVQIGINAIVRRKISAKLIPNL